MFIFWSWSRLRWLISPEPSSRDASVTWGRGKAFSVGFSGFSVKGWLFGKNDFCFWPGKWPSCLISEVIDFNSGNTTSLASFDSLSKSVYLSYYASSLPLRTLSSNATSSTDSYSNMTLLILPTFSITNSKLSLMFSLNPSLFAVNLKGL